MDEPWINYGLKRAEKFTLRASISLRDYGGDLEETRGGGALNSENL